MVSRTAARCSRVDEVMTSEQIGGSADDPAGHPALGGQRLHQAASSNRSRIVSVTRSSTSAVLPPVSRWSAATSATCSRSRLSIRWTTTRARPRAARRAARRRPRAGTPSATARQRRRRRPTARRRSCARRGAAITWRLSGSCSAKRSLALARARLISERTPNGTASPSRREERPGDPTARATPPASRRRSRATIWTGGMSISAISSPPRSAPTSACARASVRRPQPGPFAAATSPPSSVVASGRTRPSAAQRARRARRTARERERGEERGTGSRSRRRQPPRRQKRPSSGAVDGPALALRRRPASRTSRRRRAGDALDRTATWTSRPALRTGSGPGTRWRAGRRGVEDRARAPPEVASA